VVVVVATEAAVALVGAGANEEVAGAVVLTELPHPTTRTAATATTATTRRRAVMFEQ
jgi:hypothetical protein